MILAGIVIVFAVCHFFRFFLAFYHVSIVEKTRLCIENGRESAHPPWLYVISALNHLMLMVNSSVNFIIYCAVGSKFRRAVMEKFCNPICRNIFRSQSQRNSNSNGLDIVPLNENNLVRIWIKKYFDLLRLRNTKE